MIRLVCVAPLLLLLTLGGPARADWCPTEIAIPGWRVTTSEDAWANEELPNGLKRYPLSNLIDGAVHTAWVFEGPKWDGKEAGYRSRTGAAFLGGVGQWVDIRCLLPEPPLVDAVGIVNGYAKSPAVYERNNRITRLCLDGGGTPWEPAWAKTANLQQVMWLQVVPIPETRADRVRITVEAVEGGSDDDLCISEIQLFHKGRAIVPRPTPFVLSSPGDECGCGHAMHIVDSRGRLAHQRGLAAECHWCICAFSPSGKLAALSSDSGGGLMVVDLTTGRILHQTADITGVAELEWRDNTTLRVLTRSHETGLETRCELDLSERHPVLKHMGE